jgi:hypothetical protein
VLTIKDDFPPTSPGCVSLSREDMTCVLEWMVALAAGNQNAHDVIWEDSSPPNVTDKSLVVLHALLFSRFRKSITRVAPGFLQARIMLRYTHHTHSLSLSLSHTHTHTRTCTYAHTHTYNTQTHTSGCLDVWMIGRSALP